MRTPTAHLVPSKLRGALNKLGREIGRKGFDAVFSDWKKMGAANQVVAERLPHWFERTPAEILDQPAVFNMFIEKIYEGFADRVVERMFEAEFPELHPKGAAATAPMQEEFIPDLDDCHE